jgi:hypothetical protein
MIVYAYDTINNCKRKVQTEKVAKKKVVKKKAKKKK